MACGWKSTYYSHLLCGGGNGTASCPRPFAGVPPGCRHDLQRLFFCARESCQLISTPKPPEMIGDWCAAGPSDSIHSEFGRAIKGVHSILLFLLVLLTDLTHFLWLLAGLLPEEMPYWMPAHMRQQIVRIHANHKYHNKYREQISEHKPRQKPNHTWHHMQNTCQV